MKLLHKTSLYYLLFAIPALVISAFIFYHLIYSQVKEDNDESMYNDMKRIETQLGKKQVRS